MVSTENPEPSVLMSHLSRFVKLFNKRKDNDYDQVVHNIRLIILFVSAILNILYFIKSPQHSFQAALTTLAGELASLLVLVYSNNTYLAAIVFQIGAVSYIPSAASNTPHVLALPHTVFTSLVLYSIQFYPVTVNFMFVAINVLIILNYQKDVEQLFSYDEKVLQFVKSGGHAWVGAAIVIFVAINGFQVYNAKVWESL